MKTWIYHKDEEPKTIDVVDLKSFEEFGWSDDPKKFVDLVKDFGIDLNSDEAPLQIQQVGESVQGVTDWLNGLLNIDTMPGKQLVHFGKEHLDLKLKGKTLRAMRLRIKKCVEKKQHALS